MALGTAGDVDTGDMSVEVSQRAGIKGVDSPLGHLDHVTWWGTFLSISSQVVGNMAISRVLHNPWEVTQLQFILSSPSMYEKNLRQGFNFILRVHQTPTKS